MAIRITSDIAFALEPGDVLSRHDGELYVVLRRVSSYVEVRRWRWWRDGILELILDLSA